MAGYAVFHNVPILLQPTPSTCWYTSYEMVVTYERGRGRGQGLLSPNDQQYTRDLYTQGRGVGADNPEEREKVAGLLGFSCDYSSLSADGMLDLLSYDPVIYDGAWAAGGGHVVVLVGLSEGILAYNDPLSGRQSMGYDQFMGQHLSQTRSRALIYPP